MRLITILFFALLLISVNSSAQKPKYKKANKAYYIKGDYEKSLRLYQKLLDKNPLDTYALNGKGLSLYSLEKYDEALSYFNMAILFNNKELLFYQNRAICYSAQLEFDLALEDLNYVLEEDPHMALAYQNRAYVYYNQNKLDAAIHDINEALYLGPDNASCYYYRAAAYALKSEFELSEKDFRRSLKLDSTDPVVHYYFANLLCFDLHKKGEGIEHYKEAIKLGYKDESVYYALGLAYYENGQNSLAEETLTKSIELNPDSADTFFARGCARAHLQDYEGALSDFVRALEINPNDTGTLTNRALFVYDAQGEFDRAIADLQKVIELDKSMGLNAAYGYNNLGYMLYKKGQLDEAMTHVTYSLELVNMNSYAYRNLALIYIALEQYDSACNAATKSIELRFVEDYGPEIIEIKKRACL